MRAQHLAPSELRAIPPPSPPVTGGGRVAAALHVLCLLPLLSLLLWTIQTWAQWPGDLLLPLPLLFFSFLPQEDVKNTPSPHAGFLKPDHHWYGLGLCIVVATMLHDPQRAIQAGWGNCLDPGGHSREEKSWQRSPHNWHAALPATSRLYQQWNWSRTLADTHNEAKNKNFNDLSTPSTQPSDAELSSLHRQSFFFFAFNDQNLWHF